MLRHKLAIQELQLVKAQQQCNRTFPDAQNPSKSLSLYGLRVLDYSRDRIIYTTINNSEWSIEPQG